MTGWRIAWVCGNAELIKGLAQIKDSIDSGAFQAIQEAAIAALKGPPTCVEDMRQLYRRRRDVFVELMRQPGLAALIAGRDLLYLGTHAPKDLLLRKRPAACSMKPVWSVRRV